MTPHFSIHFFIIILVSDESEHVIRPVKLGLVIFPHRFGRVKLSSISHTPLNRFL